MSNDGTHEASCSHCDRTYLQPHCDDCVWTDSGRSLGGFCKGHWYGYDRAGNEITIDDPATDDRVRIVQVNIYPYGGPYDVCPTCADRHAARRDRTDYYDSDCAPSDFDPTYAGESWE